MAFELTSEQGDDGLLTLILRGPLDAEAAEPLVGLVARLVRQRRNVLLDLAGVPAIDSIGLATLTECLALARRRGTSLRARGASPSLRQALAAASAPAPEPPRASAPYLERVGSAGQRLARAALAFAHLLADTGYWAVVAPLRRRLPPPGATTEQATRIGVDSVPIVGLTGFLLGLILAFLAAYQLRQFGATIYVANLVALTMVRELGPVMTAILVAGRSGSAIAAELGTMTVNEEIDALRTMAIDPIRYLVVPRVYAISLTQPALTLFSMALGVGGGLLIGILFLDLNATIYLKQTVQALSLNDLWHGLSKSLVFAWVIVMAACHYGLRIRGGPADVGRATIASVVSSIFAVIMVDSAFAVVATVLK
ncbi:MAG: MlaE family lipid ABC transporter permease subunit [Proteobacteria bacterium]|nr:MlaE family lipid ABC transporter permease subunit [Pseudomonadota bacterium]